MKAKHDLILGISGFATLEEAKIGRSRRLNPTKTNGVTLDPKRDCLRERFYLLDTLTWTEMAIAETNIGYKQLQLQI